jgi:hypothetical protein
VDVELQRFLYNAAGPIVVAIRCEDGAADGWLQSKTRGTSPWQRSGKELCSDGGRAIVLARAVLIGYKTSRTIPLCRTFWQRSLR